MIEENGNKLSNINLKVKEDWKKKNIIDSYERNIRTHSRTN